MSQSQPRTSKLLAQNCMLEITPLKHPYPTLVPQSSEIEASRSLQETHIPQFTYGDLLCDTVQVQFHTDCRRVGLTILLKETLELKEPTKTTATFTSIDFFVACGDILFYDKGTTIYKDQDIVYFKFRYSPAFSSSPNRFRLGQSNCPIANEPAYINVLNTLRKHCSVRISIPFQGDTRSALNSLVKSLSANDHFPKELPRLHEEHRPQLGWGLPGNYLTFGDFHSLHRPIFKPNTPIDPVCYAFPNSFDYEVTQSLALHFEQLVDDAERATTVSACSGIWSARVHGSPNPSILLLELEKVDTEGKSSKKGPSTFPTDVNLSLSFCKHAFGLWSATRTEQADIQKLSNKPYSPIVSIQLIMPETDKLPQIGQDYNVQFHVPHLTNSRKHGIAIRKFAHMPDNQNQLPWSSMLHGVKIISQPQCYLHTSGHGLRHQIRRLWCDFLLSQCNREQKRAFHAALAPVNGVTLLEGPPGTGKSQIIAKVAVMFAAQGYDVLLCGSSNRQLDDLAQKCKDVQDSLAHIQIPDFLITRLYPQGKEQAEMNDEDALHNDGDDCQQWVSSLSQTLGRKQIVHLRHLTLTHHIREALKQSPPFLQKLVDLQESGHVLHPTETAQLEALFHKLQRDVLARSRIVVATPETSITELVKGHKTRFQFLIIDESSQITESVALLPIMANAASLKGLFLVGDSKQLPAVTRSLGRNPFSPQLQLSLFERLAHLGFPLYSLQIQYRMCPSIVSYPNIHTYQSRLITEYCPTTEGQSWDRFCKFQRWPIGEVALFSNGTEALQTTSNSWYNLDHVAAVLEILRGINLMTTIPMDEVTIITPYKAQARRYADFLLSNEEEFDIFKGIRVTTIDAFQGRESGVVFLDLTITASNRNSKHQSQVKTGFMSSEARLNVGLTRSKFGLVVIADRLMMKQVEQQSAIKAYSKHLNDTVRIRPLRFTALSTVLPASKEFLTSTFLLKDSMMARFSGDSSQGAQEPDPFSTSNIPHDDNINVTEILAPPDNSSTVDNSKTSSSKECNPDLRGNLAITDCNITTAPTGLPTMPTHLNCLVDVPSLAVYPAELKLASASLPVSNVSGSGVHSSGLGLLDTQDTSAPETTTPFCCTTDCPVVSSTSTKAVSREKSPPVVNLAATAPSGPAS